MKVRTNIKSGKKAINHNATFVRGATKAKSLTVKTGVKAGGMRFNHNETLIGVIGRERQ